MKSKIEQPFGYTGNVTVSAVRGKTTFYRYSSHNAGTSLLFQGLCNLLAGESYASQKERIPYFIRLYNKNGETVTPVTIAAVRYNTSLQVKSVDDNYVTVFHFAVPSTQIKKTTNLAINHLRLFGEAEVGGATADTINYVLATFDIPDGKGVMTQSLTPNTQYIVEWSLGFSNKDGSSSTQSAIPATNTSTPETDNTSSTEEADPSESAEPEDPTENEES